MKKLIAILTITTFLLSNISAVPDDTPFPFQYLPEGPQLEVFNHLKLSDLKNLSETCKDINFLVWQIRVKSKEEQERLNDFFICCCRGSYDEVSILHIQNLIKNGANISGRSGFCNDSPLHSASLAGRTDVAQLLITLAKEHGLDIYEFVNAKNLMERAPLYEVRNIPIAKLLLDNGAEVNATGKDNRTSLHYVACNNRAYRSYDNFTESLIEEMASFLLENGANPTLSCIERNDRSVPPSALTNNKEIKSFLEEAEENWNLMMGN
jgi:ankyrin repeat protein